MFHPPTGFSIKKSYKPSKPPKKQLTLEWVYGFNGFLEGDCLKKIPATGELAYGAGIVVVLLDIENKRQRHYREHTGCVTALAVSISRTGIKGN